MKPFICLVSMVVVAATACKNNSQPTTTASVQKPTITHSPQEQITRGKYLVSVAGCNDCHSPKKFTAQGPVPDMDRMLSGYDASQPLSKYDPSVVKNGQWLLFNGQLTAFVGPWGVSFAANLTPDATGIGNWSLAQFKKAFTQGKYMGLDSGRALLPPMPWQEFAHMTNEDVEAVYAYLKSIKPVKNIVPAPIPPKS